MTESSMEGLLSAAFYGAMLLALAFFVHKVCWLIQFRKIQARLVGHALARLRETTETTLLRFDRGADSSWTEVSGAAGGESPIEFVMHTERRLAALVRDMKASHRPIRDVLVRGLRGDGAAGSEGDDERPVLTIPRLYDAPIELTLDPSFRALATARSIDPSLFTLKVRSRYGLLPRALAFFIGAADVVYSSAHVARMSQNQAVPISVLLRRMSLVLLILLAIAVDITFQARARLIAWCARAFAGFALDDPGPVGELLNAHLPTMMGLTFWLAGYGAIYLGLFVFLRNRSASHMRRLDELRVAASARERAIVGRQRDELVTWAGEYGRTLDDASTVAVRQAEMLVQRTIARLRRRLASPQLLTRAEQVAHALFERLPESSTALRDVATDHRHSFGHLLWPRPDEMHYQVKLAQYRAAWRDLEVSIAALRGPRPEPHQANQLWRNLVAYGRMFRDALPEGLAGSLAGAYDESIASIVEETEADLRELDGRLTQLAEGLARTFSTARPLVESRLKLAEENIEAEMAHFVAEILRVREQARLEAMAFEI
jgi:hypothetical protein